MTKYKLTDRFRFNATAAKDFEVGDVVLVALSKSSSDKNRLYYITDIRAKKGRVFLRDFYTGEELSVNYGARRLKEVNKQEIEAEQQRPACEIYPTGTYVIVNSEHANSDLFSRNSSSTGHAEKPSPDCIYVIKNYTDSIIVLSDNKTGHKFNGNNILACHLRTPTEKEIGTHLHKNISVHNGQNDNNSDLGAGQPRQATIL